ncbi:hypothetical protein [Actinomadura litoris]|uniref:Uncharacterized protein n=1 Tax=Actinomadura litoris TaxID=2678616 RepID=A0A7K1L784_9ACTN|nr:hypothetical protein [Actinomadura litoris]MUN40297.1 hypothetical protein [Actinomadura litoris]
MEKPQQRPGVGDAEAQKAALRREFSAWSIIHTDTGRWWATRSAGQVRDGDRTGRGPVVSEVDADTAEGLRVRLRRVEAGEFPGGALVARASMLLSLELWQDTLAALGAGDVRARKGVSARLLAAAPPSWELVPVAQAERP